MDGNFSITAIGKESASRVVVQPGDIFMVTSAGYLSSAVQKSVTDAIKNLFGDSHPVVFLRHDLQLSVMHKEDQSFNSQAVDQQQ